MSTTLPTRLVRLLTGLALFGASVALMVRADLGLSSWDVLHQGLATRTGLPLGWIVNGVALLVLLLWFPLRQRPGLGTVANVALVGLALDAVLAVLPPPSALPTRVGLLVLGILLNGVATGLYLGARLGPGPRDGLMTGLAARGLPVGRVRTGIELAVLAVGWLLGGTVGPGTLLYALSIGPLAQFLIPRLAVPVSGRHTTTGVTPPCPA
ncbi:YitT family protein [Micromonospora sp. NPDC048930]|uniref:membrane protein YczE n=1 Tax=Micromonospora sp. NPDC048930 TaxID=3364261 RepID=UPI00371DF1D9